MKYLALLRGINVGGKSTVRMAELQESMREAGFRNVSTFINSGNVLFESDETDIQQLTKQIDALLLKTFFAIKTVVISDKNLEDIIKHSPDSWTKNDLRKYIAFIKSPSVPEDIIQEVQLKEGIDFIEKGPGVVFMSTKMDGLTKSGFPKLITKKVYQDITIRNYNTVEKLALMMRK